MTTKYFLSLLLNSSECGNSHTLKLVDPQNPHRLPMVGLPTIPHFFPHLHLFYPWEQQIGKTYCPICKRKDANSENQHTNIWIISKSYYLDPTQIGIMVRISLEPEITNVD